MRICLVIREFWPLKGGLTLHAHRLSQELIRAGHEIEVVTLFTTIRPSGNNLFWAKEPKRFFHNDGVPTHVIGLNLAERLFLLPLKKLQWRNETRELAKKMLQFVMTGQFARLFHDADLVHYDGAGMEFLGFAAAKAARKCGKPFLVQPSVHIGQWGHLPVDLELSPPLNYLWPNMSKTTSTVFDSEYSINLFLNYKKSHTIKIDSMSEKKILVSSSGLENDIKIINK